MTKSELIARLATRYSQLVAKDAEFTVKMILDAMTQSLVKGQRIEIRGFGSFGLNHRPARVGRNPKSGERVHVPEKFVPHFKAGKELRARGSTYPRNSFRISKPARNCASGSIKNRSLGRRHADGGIDEVPPFAFGVCA